MSGHDDDLPEYLRGVVQADGDGNQPEPPPQERRGSTTPIYDDDDFDDDDDDYGDRPPLISPLLVLIVVGVFGLACIGFLGSTVIGGSFVGSAQEIAAAESKELVAVVLQEEKIIDGLVSRGGNRATLEKLYGRIESEKGLKQGLAALAYGREIERQCVQLGDLRGTTMDKQRGDIVLALDDFEEALAAWDASAGGPFGALAVTFGMANEPPDWHPE